WDAYSGTDALTGQNLSNVDRWGDGFAAAGQAALVGAAVDSFSGNGPGAPFPADAQPGQTLTNIDPNSLSAGRVDLVASRLAAQQDLIQQGIPRYTPIQATPDGVIWDGNHGAAAAAFAGQPVTVEVVPGSIPSQGPVTALPIRN